MSGVIRLMIVALGPLTVGVGLGQNPVPQDLSKGPGLNEDLRGSYCGKVVALSKEGVTLKPQGFVKTVAYHPLGNGQYNTREYIQDNTRQPMAFVFTEEFLNHSGLHPTYRGDSSVYHGHKVGDLRIGDVIRISCRSLAGKDYCLTAWIERRPGGTIPPTIGDNLIIETEKKTGEKSVIPRYHLVMSEIQAREEKSVAALAKVALRFLR